MTRSLVGVGWLLMALVAAPADVSAQNEPRVRASKSPKQATISLQAGQLHVVQRLTRDAFDLHLTEGGDTVRFTGDLGGNVTVQRGTTQHGFSMRTAGPADQARLLALLAGSTALGRFDEVMNTAWGRSAKPAAVFRSAHSLLAVLRGNAQPVAALVAAVATPKVTLVPARRDGPDACWSAYSHDVLRYTYDLESCIEESRSSFFPLHLGWCAYEYNIKTSLAFVWMLDCYSVL